MKKIKTAFLKKPYFYSIIGLIIIIIIAVFAFGGNGDGSSTVVVRRSDFRKQVSVSGKVVASESADLGFEQGGRVSSLLTPVGTQVKKGQTIASTENGDLYAEVLQKQASLEREVSELTSLTTGTRPEQLTIDEQEYTDSTKALYIALRKANLDIENILITKIDTLFRYGSSVNPTLETSTGSYTRDNVIEKKRLVISEKLRVLQSSNAKIEDFLPMTHDLLDKTKELNNELIKLTQDLQISAGYSQAEVDEYRNTINTAGQDIATVLDTVQGTEAEWTGAKNTLNLSKAGSTKSDIESQNASVKASRADLLSAQARLAKTIIKAPFDGLITRMDLKVGEIVSPNTSEVSIMSASSFEIESYIPEVHIAYIVIGNPVTVSLDAYGTGEIFLATVKSIDPAETVRDGVSTYKVKMIFNSADPRIRSGMTANAVITTLEKKDTVVLPQSAIITKDSMKYVKKIINKEIVESTIETGSSTSLGQVEIINGVSEGDEIIINPEK